MTLPLIGTIDLAPEACDQPYPGTFFVSPSLSGEMIFGHPWFEQHNVIHEHRLGCIYLGNQERRRLYLVPEPQQQASNTTPPEVTHNFPPKYAPRFLEMMKRHAPVFYQGGPLRQTLAVQHHIELSHPTPFIEAPRRYSEEKRKWLDAQIREMLADEIIEPTTSDYSSAIVVAGKKDGDYRFCVDYRRLNEQTVDAPQCLPRIHEILKDLGDATIFSSLDFKSGYWQVPLTPECRHLAAFSAPSGGQYQPRVMFFGLKNAPGTFQNLIRHVLAEQWGQFAIAYLDDIIVYSKKLGRALTTPVTSLGKSLHLQYDMLTEEV